MTGQRPKGGIQCGSSFFAEDDRWTYRWQKPDDMDALFALCLADFSTNKGVLPLHTSSGQYMMKEVSQFL
jgi:hypothetical protein